MTHINTIEMNIYCFIMVNVLVDLNHNGLCVTSKLSLRVKYRPSRLTVIERTYNVTLCVVYPVC